MDPIRAELAGLLTAPEWAAAAASTLNAHYTDPVVVAAVWRAVQDLGFTGGPVLEPGCGSGNFIGAAPPGAVMTGVELDPTTAAIAAALYPSAAIHAEGFEAPGWQPGSFAAVVGNVPFGGFKVYDPEFNPAGHTIHNHFLVKSLALTAPGGIVAAVTSAYTLDAASPAARRDLHALGDLLGAVRLPSGAFKAVAGTDVVTDLLIFRRRPQGRLPATPRRVGTGRRHRHRRRHHRGEPVLRRPPRTHPRHPRSGQRRPPPRRTDHPPAARAGPRGTPRRPAVHDRRPCPHRRAVLHPADRAVAAGPGGTEHRVGVRCPSRHHPHRPRRVGVPTPRPRDACLDPVPGPHQGRRGHRRADRPGDAPATRTAGRRGTPHRRAGSGGRRQTPGTPPARW